MYISANQNIDNAISNEIKRTFFDTVNMIVLCSPEHKTQSASMLSYLAESFGICCCFGCFCNSQNEGTALFVPVFRPLDDKVARHVLPKRNCQAIFFLCCIYSLQQIISFYFRLSSHILPKILNKTHLFDCVLYTVKNALNSFAFISKATKKQQHEKSIWKEKKRRLKKWFAKCVCKRHVQSVVDTDHVNAFLLSQLFFCHKCCIVFGWFLSLFCIKLG